MRHRVFVGLELVRGSRELKQHNRAIEKLMVELMSQGVTAFYSSHVRTPFESPVLRIAYEGQHIDLVYVTLYGLVEIEVKTQKKKNKLFVYVLSNALERGHILCDILGPNA